MFLICEKYRETNQRLIRLFLHVKKNVPVFSATAVNGQPHASRHYILIAPKMAAAYHNAVHSGGRCCTTVLYILVSQSLTLTSSVLVKENGFYTFLVIFIRRKTEQIVALLQEFTGDFEEQDETIDASSPN